MAAWCTNLLYLFGNTQPGMNSFKSRIQDRGKTYMIHMIRPTYVFALHMHVHFKVLIPKEKQSVKHLTTLRYDQSFRWKYIHLQNFPKVIIEGLDTNRNCQIFVNFENSTQFWQFFQSAFQNPVRHYDRAFLRKQFTASILDVSEGSKYASDCLSMFQCLSKAC